MLVEINSPAPVLSINFSMNCHTGAIMQFKLGYNTQVGVAYVGKRSTSDFLLVE